jgi:hypothetical protein
LGRAKGKRSGRAEAIQQQVAAQARDEPQAEQVEEREHDFGGPCVSVVCSRIGRWVCRIASRVWIASRSATDTTFVPYWLFWSETQLTRFRRAAPKPELAGHRVRAGGAPTGCGALAVGA